MGFSSTQKGYRLYDLDTRTFFISRDVVFGEEIFPFKLLKSNEENFPLLSPSIDNADANDCDQSTMQSILHSNESHETVVEPAEAEVMMEPGVEVEVMMEPEEVDPIPVDDLVHPGEVQQDNIVPRKTSRATKPPLWIKDYIVPQKSHPHSLTNTICYDNISTNYKNYLNAFSAVVEP